MKYYLLSSLFLFTHVLSAQNVGIGESSPAQKLDINGNVRIQGNQLYGGASGSFNIFSNGGFRIDLDEDGGGSETFRIANGSNTLVFEVTEGGNVEADGNADFNGNLTLSGTSRSISSGDALNISSTSGLDVILDSDASGTGSEFYVKRDGSSGTNLFRVDEQGDATVYNKLKLTPLAAAPTGAKGDIYMDNTTNKLYYHDGTAWREVVQAGSVPETDPQVGTTLSTFYVPTWSGTALENSGTIYASGSQTRIDAGDFYIGATAAASNLLYLSSFLVDWDDISYYVDPNSTSVLNEVHGDAGSATDPSFTFRSDENTGMFSPAADNIAFTTNGTEKFRVLSDGIATFNSNNSQAYPPYYGGGGGAFSWNFTGGQGEISMWNNVSAGSPRGFSFRQMTSATAQTELMRINGSGTVTINALGTGYVKSTAGTLASSATVPWTDVTGAPAFLTAYTETDPQVGTIATNGVPRWNGTSLVTGTILDNGTQVGIGAINTSFKLNVSGNTRSGDSNGVVDMGSDGNAFIEMREIDNSGTPFIDFSNDNTIDFDARIRLTGDDALAVEGSNLIVSERVFGKMRHITHHNFNIPSGAYTTNSGYVWFPAAGGEVDDVIITTSAVDRQTNATVMPYSGRIVRVIFRTDNTSSNGGDEIKGRLSFDRNGVITISSVAINQNQGGSGTYDFPTTGYSFVRGDRVVVGLNLVNNALCNSGTCWVEDNDYFVTIIWEYDVFD